MQDILPDTLMEESLVKLTSAEWHQANFPNPQLNFISKRMKNYQLFFDTKLQVSSSTGPSGTSTPSCPTSTTDDQSGVVTPSKNHDKLLVTSITFKITTENSDAKAHKVGNKTLNPN